MKKEDLINLLKKIYTWCIGKGWSETVVKILIGCLFGIICALCFSSCTVAYKTDGIDFSAGIITPIEYHK